MRLVYIDPPFATASDFVSRNQIHAYSDSICGSEFVEFLRERLVLLRELLASDGSIYLHLDGKMAFQMKIIMDEILEKITAGHLLQERNVVLRIIPKYIWQCSGLYHVLLENKCICME